MHSPPVHTVSFDLYDTVLVRPVLRPTDIFDLVEQELGLPGWAAARIDAEHRARRVVENHEASFDEIHASLASGPFAEFAPLAREHELTWERRTRVAPEAAALIAAERSGGARILFVSDMYLPRALIESLISDVFRPGDILHLSHEQRCGKGSGLWQRLVTQHPKPWRHYGDNPNADGACARAVGIQAVAVTALLPNEREYLLHRENPGRPLVAGLARLARVLRPAEVDRAWNDGADIVGPVFLSFTRWALQTARERGVKAVYFLARDGELPCSIAQILTHGDANAPLCRYLYGSRHAFYNAAFDIQNPVHREWMMFASPSTVRGVLANLKCAPETLAPWLRAADAPPETWDTPRTPLECLTFLQKLAAAPGAEEWSARRFEEHTAPALHYFEQETVFEHDHVALVDIGWSGTTLVSFRAILERGDRPIPRITGLFFGLHRNKTPDRFAYAFAPSAFPHWAQAYPAVLEMMVPGTHGQVTALGWIEPDRAGAVCSPATTAPEPIIRALHDGALTYTRLALTHGVIETRHNDALRAAVECPTQEESKRWARFQFGSLQTEDSLNRIALASKTTARHVLKIFLLPGRDLHRTPWPNATVVLTWPRCPRGLLRLLSLKYRLERFAFEYFRRFSNLFRRAHNLFIRVVTWPRRKLLVLLAGGSRQRR